MEICATGEKDAHALVLARVLVLVLDFPLFSFEVEVEDGDEGDCEEQKYDASLRQTYFSVLSTHRVKGSVWKVRMGRLSRKWEMCLIAIDYEISLSDVRSSGHPVNEKVYSNYAKWGG